MSDTYRHSARPFSVNHGVFLHMMLALIGAALLVAAFGLWLLPHHVDLPALSLIKLGASLFMLAGGLACLLVSRCI